MEARCAVAEERLGKRLNMSADFPRSRSSRFENGRATVRDVETVAIGYDSNANLAAKVAHVLKTPIESAPALITHFQRRGKMRGFKEMVAEACGVDEADCRFDVVRVEHHLAHLASAYYASDFDEAAGFSYDGSGDFASAMYARCRNNQIEILGRVAVPHSLGFFYTTICHLIGFEKFGEEYKVMAWLPTDSRRTWR
jgi:carbamoyltransferase